MKGERLYLIHGVDREHRYVEKKKKRNSPRTRKKRSNKRGTPTRKMPEL